MEVRVFDGQFFIDGFPVRRGFRLQGERKLLSYIAKDDAGCFPIEEKDGEILFEEGAADAVYWKSGIEIRPPVRFKTPAKRETLTANGQSVEVLIREGKGSSVSIEGSFAIRLKHEIADARAEILGGQSAPILNLRAKANGGDYIALIAMPREGAKLLLEGAGEIETSGNDVLIKEPLSDERKRVRTSRYFWQGASFALTSRTFERGATPVFNEKNAGRLLLEAVAADDSEDILSYLAPEIADEKEIERYFGSFDIIRAPLFSPSQTAVAVQKRLPDRTACVTYDFSFEGGKITNIINEE